jgi:hypothetical protein
MMRPLAPGYARGKNEKTLKWERNKKRSCCKLVSEGLRAMDFPKNGGRAFGLVKASLERLGAHIA